MVRSKVKVQLCFPTPSIVVHICEEYFCPISRFKFGGNMYSTRLSTTEGGRVWHCGSKLHARKRKTTALIIAKFQHIRHVKAGVIFASPETDGSTIKESSTPQTTDGVQQQTNHSTFLSIRPSLQSDTTHDLSPTIEMPIDLQVFSRF